MKNTKNTIINLSSFGITSLIGLYLYFLLVKNGGETVLGIFNIQYIFIVLFSQIATFGIHYSVLREASAKNLTKDDNFNNLMSGLTIVFFNAALLSLFIIIFQKVLSDYLGFNVIKIIYPVILFSLNKIFYYFLNGKEQYIKMAFVSPFRFIIFLITLLNIIDNGLDVQSLYNCFLYAEILVFFVVSFFVLKKIKLSFKNKQFLRYLFIHLKYGRKAFATSFLSDLNLKIDIILIGILLGNESVGFYTFTSAIGEGFIALIAATRTISTPQFGNLVIDKTRFIKFKKNIFKISYSLFLPIGVIILIFSKVVSSYFVFFENLSSNGFFSLIIIVIGFAVLSYCFAFEHILLQINRPEEHTKSLLLLFGSNIIFNIILINLLGINGAALATITSYFLYFLQINKRLYKVTDNSFLP